MAHVQRPGVPPRPAPIDAQVPGALCVQAERAQARFAGMGPLPLTPRDDAQSTADPRVQFLQGAAALRVLEVVHPAAQDRPQLLDGPHQRVPAPPQAQVGDAVA